MFAGSKCTCEGVVEPPTQARITVGSEANIEFLPPPEAWYYGYRYALRICGKRETVIGFPTVSDQDHFVSTVTTIFSLIECYDEKFLFDSLETANWDYSEDYWDGD